jgi:DNA mismatch endonuclease (patch repair protein)
MDIWDKEKRSEVMSKIRSKNTKPEMILRKALFARGFRYRVNDRRLPGTPDIVLPRYRTVIFVHGCFWHGHESCKYASTPKSNIGFWVDKITTNKKRDMIHTEQLIALGWTVLTVWECDIRHHFKHDLPRLIDAVEAGILQGKSGKISLKIYEERGTKVSLVAEDTIEYDQTPSASKTENH